MDIEFFLCGFHELGKIKADKVWLFEINGFPCEPISDKKNIKIEQKINYNFNTDVCKQKTQDVNLDSRYSENFLFHDMKEDLSTASE